MIMSLLIKVFCSLVSSFSCCFSGAAAYPEFNVKLLVLNVMLDRWNFLVVVVVVNGSYSAAPYSSPDRECITKSQLRKIKQRRST